MPTIKMVSVPKPKTESQDCYNFQVNEKIVLKEVTGDDCYKYFYHHCPADSVLEIHYSEKRQIKMMKKDIQQLNFNTIEFSEESFLGKEDRTKKRLSHPQQAYLYQQS